MSEIPSTRLKVLVERAVRPVRASASVKRRMREELLAHVTAVFEEEAARQPDAGAALARTAERFGRPAELTAQLQGSVPALDAVRRVVDGFTDGVSPRPGETTFRRVVRYVVGVEAFAAILVFAIALLLWWQQGDLPASAAWYALAILLVTGVYGLTLGLVETSLRRALAARTWTSWLRLALVIAGSGLVSVPLGLAIYGANLDKALWLSVFTVILPAVLAWAMVWGMICGGPSPTRDDQDWASLRVE